MRIMQFSFISIIVDLFCPNLPWYKNYRVQSAVLLALTAALSSRSGNHKMEKPNMKVIRNKLLTDDPEGWVYLDKTSRRAGEDSDIYILHNFHGVNAYEVGCFQAISDIVIQKSIREGFGLVVAEALRKGKPVIGGKVGGIPLQVIDGTTGYLVVSSEECAKKTLYLLQSSEKIKEMGKAAREHVRENFLITRHLRDYLQLFVKLAGKL